MEFDLSTKPSDDDLLDFSLMLKKTMIDTMTRDGIPDDHDARDQLLKVSDSLDRTLIGKKKLKIEESDSTNAAETNRILAEVLLSHKARVTKSQRIERDVELPDELSEISVVEGETDIGISHLEL